MVARRLRQVCTYGVKAMVVARDCARAGPTWSPRGTLEMSTVDDQTTHYYNDAFDNRSPSTVPDTTSPTPTTRSTGSPNTTASTSAMPT
jgi:hypothetical protein